MANLGSFKSTGQRLREEGRRAKAESISRNPKTRRSPAEIKQAGLDEPQKTQISPQELVARDKIGVPVIRAENETYQQALDRSAQLTAQKYAEQYRGKQVSVTLTGTERTRIEDEQTESPQIQTATQNQPSFVTDIPQGESPTRLPDYVQKQKQNEFNIFSTKPVSEIREYEPDTATNLFIKSNVADLEAQRNDGLGTLKGAGATGTAFFYGFLSRGISTAKYVTDLLTPTTTIPTIVGTGKAITNPQTYSDIKTNIVTNPSGSAGALSFDLVLGASITKISNTARATPQIESRSNVATTRTTNIDTGTSIDRSVQSTKFTANNKPYFAELESQAKNVPVNLGDEPSIFRTETGTIKIFNQDGIQVGKTSTFSGRGQFIAENELVIGGNEFNLKTGRKTIQGRTSFFSEPTITETQGKTNSFDFTGITKQSNTKRINVETGRTGLIYSEQAPLSITDGQVTLTTNRNLVQNEIFYTESTGSNAFSQTSPTKVPDYVIVQQKASISKPIPSNNLNLNTQTTTITNNKVVTTYDALTETAIKNTPVVQPKATKPLAVISPRTEKPVSVMTTTTAPTTTIQSFESASSSALAPRYKTESFSSTKTATLGDVAQSPFQRIGQASASSSASKSATRITQESITGTSSALDNLQLTNQAQATITQQKAVTTPPFIPPRTAIPIPQIRPPITNNRNNDSQRFEAFSFKRGRLEKIGGIFGSREEASIYARRLVGGTSRASFKVTRLGMRAPEPVSEFAGEMFRPAKSRKRRGFLVEKNKFRIDTGGERGEITFKGIAVSKAKKQFKLF